VRLVADHELVGRAAHVADVPGEPRVGLDRERVALRRLLTALDRIGEALAVALLAQVALELGDEQAPVREDQDAERARGLDEPGRGDRLAGRRRMTEAVAADRARIRLVARKLLEHVFLRRLVRFLVVLVGLDLLERRAVPVQRLFGLLGRRDELGEHAGERVDLVAPQLGPRGEPLRPVAEHALEAEHQAVANLPGGRRLTRPRVHLRERVVERAAASGPRCEYLLRVFLGVQERLACPGFRAERRGCEAALRRCRRMVGRLLHLRSTVQVLQPSMRSRSLKVPRASVATAKYTRARV